VSEKNMMLRVEYRSVIKRAFALALAVVLLGLLTVPDFHGIVRAEAEQTDIVVVPEIPETDIDPLDLPPVFRPNPEIIETDNPEEADTTRIVGTELPHIIIDTARVTILEPPDPPPGVYIPVDVDPEPVVIVQPDYPDKPLAAGIEGRVIVHILLDTDGTPKRAIVLQGAGLGFDEAAIEAALQCRFTPAYQGVTPVKVWVTVPFVFSINR
jgi:TonB family protein